MFNSSIQSSKQQLFTVCAFTVCARNVCILLSCMPLIDSTTVWWQSRWQTDPASHIFNYAFSQLINISDLFFCAHFLASLLGLGRFGFFKFGSIRFSFNLEYLVRFFRFRFLHISAMKARAAGKTSKGSETVEAFTPSTSSMYNQQLLLTWITGRDATFDSKTWIIRMPDLNCWLWLFEKSK